MQKSGYKTKQQDFLFSYLKEMKGKHFTAEEVREHFVSKNIQIGIATIYRQLEKLVADGTLQKYFIDEHSAACFEYSGDDCKAEVPHFHLKCEQCGNLFHVECEEIQELSEHLQKEHGFAINPFRTVLYGICNACKALLLALILMFATNASGYAKSKIKIISTIFPMYDWTREIVGNQKETSDNIDLTLLVGNGVDLHSYQPSFQDIAKISTADIFIYVGGESDTWVKDALKNKKNKDMIVLNLMEILGDQVKEEEIVEGLEAEEEEEEEVEYDEHVWLSLKNAKVICKAITDALCQKDSTNAASYKKNFSEYSAQLDQLDTAYSTAIKSASKNTLIFGDRFPFRYLVDDYNLNYYAAFVGCSAETEASFKTVIFLAKKMDELDSNYIFKIESGDEKLCKTIIQNSSKKNARVLVLDSMQSVTSKQAASTSYLKIMNENLNVLKEGIR